MDWIGPATVVLAMLVIIWQTLALMGFRRRLARAEVTMAAQHKALTSLYVMGLLTDDDWPREPRVRRRREVTIEPKPEYRDVDDRWNPETGSYSIVPDHYERWPKPPIVGPVGGAGNSGARR